MKNPKIAEKLKEYRKINHLSVDESRSLPA